MGEKKYLVNPPEKVLQIYRAVMDMVNEGSDINNMKVSDITARAGIGKGTAYEYFSSKEEIITQALSYDVNEKLKLVEGIAESGNSFEQKNFQILDFIEEHFAEVQTFCTLVRIGTGSYEISESLRKAYEQLQDDISCNRAEQLIDRIMEQGIKEGVIREENFYFRRLAFSAQMLTFAACLANASQNRDVPVGFAEAKQFAYRSMVKSLN